MKLDYRLVNVFALGDLRYSGNPLAVFPEADALDERTMQAVARELNLSETTFVLRPTRPEATARVRIFTPAFEMPFAGHPTLGTAHVIGHGVRPTSPTSASSATTTSPPPTNLPDDVVLEMAVGLVHVTLDGSRAELRTARAPVTRPWRAPDDIAREVRPADLAAALGLPADAFAGPPLWVDTGVEQLVVRLAHPELVHAMHVDAAALLRLARSERPGDSMIYAFADHASGPGDGHHAVDPDHPLHVDARFLFTQHGALVEDPATGSACANLGGYLLANGATGPLRRVVHQGAVIDRPSELHLRIDASGAIHVAGRIHAVGRGSLTVA